MSIQWLLMRLSFCRKIYKNLERTKSSQLEFGGCLDPDPGIFGLFLCQGDGQWSLISENNLTLTFTDAKHVFVSKELEMLQNLQLSISLSRSMPLLGWNATMMPPNGWHFNYTVTKCTADNTQQTEKSWNNYLTLILSLSSCTSSADCTCIVCTHKLTSSNKHVVYK